MKKKAIRLMLTTIVFLVVISYLIGKSYLTGE